MKKAPGAPRRFKSAYMFFSTWKHKDIHKQCAERGDEKVAYSAVKSDETNCYRFNSDRHASGR